MPAFGDNECGAPIGGIATCTSAGNDFTDGITYTVNDLTIVLESDVVVDTDAAAEPGVSTIAAGALVVYAYPGTAITTTVVPPLMTRSGLSIGIAAICLDLRVSTGRHRPRSKTHRHHINARLRMTCSLF